MALQASVAVPPIGEGEVHVWRAPLDVDGRAFSVLSATLGDDEQERARRLTRERDRRRFIACRAVLRALVGAYLGVDPAKLAFSYGRYGKPELARPVAALEFNVAHSGELALVAIARDLRLGVDVEEIRDGVERDELARRFFSPAERRLLRELPAARQTAGFFACWVRKEAYLKGRGVGLSEPLNTFDVSVAPDSAATLLRRPGRRPGDSAWFLQDLDLGPRYAAALAVDAPGSSVRTLQYVDAAPAAASS